MNAAIVHSVCLLCLKRFHLVLYFSCGFLLHSPSWKNERFMCHGLEVDVYACGMFWTFAFYIYIKLLEDFYLK